MKKNFKQYTMQLSMILLLLLTSFTVSAETKTPYSGYSYDFWGVSVPASIGHVPEKVIYGEDVGIGSLKSPQDLFVYNDKLYVLDTANARVVVFNADFTVSKVISSFSDDTGLIELKKPVGIFIKNDLLYLCDTDAGFVYVSTLDGKISQKLGKPDSE
ncbi:MAG: NHL repeat-containing protein, partial [Saccharofermentanales bacterium]